MPQWRRTAPAHARTAARAPRAATAAATAMQGAGGLAVTAGLVGVAAAAATAAALRWQQRRRAGAPELLWSANEFNDAILARCPSLRRVFVPPAWMPNEHFETVLAAKLRSAPGVSYRRELLPVDESGGVVALDWADSCEQVSNGVQATPPACAAPAPEADAPLCVLLPGLTGGSGDSYVNHMVSHLLCAGYRVVVFNSRGTANSSVRTPQFYSASFTGDLERVVDHLQANKSASAAPLYAIGWSLGANILVNYLGKAGEDTPVNAAVSLCNPFDLTFCDRALKKGFARVYDSNLAKSIARIFQANEAVFRTKDDIDVDAALASKTIRDFDAAVTAPTFGWPSVDAYYEGSASSNAIPGIRVPTLCIQADDDPIAPGAAIPRDKIRTNENCTLCVTPAGGHLGWATAADPFGAPWVDVSVVEYLKAVEFLSLKRKLAAVAV